jgi:hypothetical protein
MKRRYLILCFMMLGFAGVKAQPLTYKDVAPIFYNKCAMCHNPHGIAPMPLLNYTETFAYRSFIKIYILQGLMPPWPPDTTYHKFFNQRVLSYSEKNQIINWIDSGAQKGDTTLAPVAPVFTNAYQLHGTPDLVIKIPTFTSNANANDAYNCFVIPSGLTQDRIIRAYEIVPGNAAIVHHALVSIDTSGTAHSDVTGSCYSMPGSDVLLGGYAPGSNPVLYPTKAPLKLGFRLKANCNLVFQIHYPAGTGGQVDSTEIRIFFYPIGSTGIREMYSNTMLQNWSMFIPANTIQQYTAQYPASGGMPMDVSIYAAFPHQHKVGVSITNYAFSGVDTVPLIRINKWDFRWQGYYIYPSLVKIPTGYTMFSSHIYDNTTNNPNNPNSPPQNVTAGVNTTNEMLFDSYQYLPYVAGDDTINIANLLKGDTLLAVNNPAPPLTVATKAYPNPFTTEVHIGYTLNTAAMVTISVYNIYGEKVRSLVNHQRTMGAGYYESVWNGKSDNGSTLSPGVYIYVVNANKLVSTGRFVLIK